MGQRDLITRYLRSSKLLGSLDAPHLAAIADIATLQSAGKGERLFDQGSECAGMFVVGMGQVKVYKVSPDGKEHLLHMVCAGETFAEAALFGGFDYPASAEAVAASELVFLPKRPMLQLLADHPAVPLKLLAGMSIWLRRMVDLMEDLVLRDAAGRIAKHILSLQSDDKATVVQMTLKHQELAAHMGMTRETISRTLAHLESLGLITLMPKGKIRLKDAAGLAQLAGR
ncbi:MAG: Crp/Fnr family transcriptional regulator [Phycisphaerae bacterium]|nr:Crp/Fnr family transcriptional regulator [Phycisphaerae bacterium]